MKKKKEHKQNQTASKNPSKPRKSEFAGKRNYYIVLALILLVSFIAYLPLLKNGFVNWDDHAYIRDNLSIRSINLKEVFAGYVMGNYHPLTMLTYAIEYQLFGLSEKGYHAVSLLLHLFNIILVFYAVLFLSNKTEVALVAAALFGIHPLHVESVAWASELKDLLYTLFFLASYIFYLKFLKNEQRKFYYYSLLMYLLSLFSKGMAVCLPAVLILTDYFLGNKINKKSLLEKVPFFVLSIIFGVLAVFAQQASAAFEDIAIFTFPQRIVFACYGFVIYLVKMILPIHLSSYYPYPVGSGSPIPVQYYFYLVYFVALVAFVFYTLRFSKKIIFGIGFFAITIFLVLQLLPVGGTIIADRYSYIPSIGIFYLAGEGFYWLWNKRGIKSGAIIMLSIFVVFFSITSYARCGVWKNGMFLWNDVISKNQAVPVPVAYYSRANLFVDENKSDEAISDFNKAIELKSNYSQAYNNRGNLLMNLKKYDEALKDFEKAIELNQSYAEAYNNRGILLMSQGKYDQALSDYNKAIQLTPGYVEAYNNRGILFKNQGKFEEAINDYNKAISFQPDFLKAYYNQGLVFMDMKRYDEAFRNFNKAVQLQPDLAGAYYYRGMSAYNSGKKDVACPDFKKAASMGMQSADNSYNNLCR